MVSVQSKQNNRKINGIDNDGGGSVVDESSPPYQTRKDGSGSGRNSNSRDLIKPDFENDGDDASDQEEEDVVQEGSDDGDLYWRVEQEIKERDFDDALIDSLDELRISQEALQLEIQKFWFIGNGSFLPDGDDSANYRSEAAEASAVDLGFHGSCSSVGDHSGKKNSSSSMEHQVASLTDKIKKLESKLEELQGVIALKNSRIAELEALKNSRIAELETGFTGGEFAKEESACNIIFLDEKFKELKTELESFFRQKIETEIKCLAIKKMMLNLKVASALAEKRKAMSGSEGQILKLEEAGNEDPIMKNITDEELVLQGLEFVILIIFLCLILVLKVVWMSNSEEVVAVPT